LSIIKTQFLFVKLVQIILVANYEPIMGVFGKTLNNVIINSHNLQMLCCELNMNFQKLSEVSSDGEHNTTL